MFDLSPYSAVDFDSQLRFWQTPYMCSPIIYSRRQLRLAGHEGIPNIPAPSLQLSSSFPLGFWFRFRVLGKFKLQCYKESSLLCCIFTGLSQLPLKTVTFVHYRKQAKQTPDGPNNTKTIPSRDLFSAKVVVKF